MKNRTRQNFIIYLTEFFVDDFYLSFIINNLI